MIQKITSLALFPYLKNYRDMPEYLYIRGLAKEGGANEEPFFDSDPKLKGQKLKICIIGARKHTAYGVRVVEELIKELAPYNPIIVSGLAVGIDSIAIETAIKFNLQTIAIIGSGLDDDSIYPRENLPLVYQMLNHGGLVISEYEEGEKGLSWHFPRRNRIMAAISDAIIIVEGAQYSGTLITARLGLDYSKNIICIPGSIFSPLSVGPLTLIEHGATPLVQIKDIVEILNLQLNLQNDDDTNTVTKINDPHKQNTKSKFLTLKDESNESDKYKSCSYDEAYVLKVLTEPLDRDELSEITQYSFSALQIILVQLEIRGFITEKYGKIVRV